MREIIVSAMYECPFKGTESYQLSELTSGCNDVCLLLDSDDCMRDKCPLIKEGTINVTWMPNES